jgi:hypothetical protein
MCVKKQKQAITTKQTKKKTTNEKNPKATNPDVDNCGESHASTRNVKDNLLLRFTNFDYPFGIFKHFLQHSIMSISLLEVVVSET